MKVRPSQTDSGTLKVDVLRQNRSRGLRAQHMKRTLLGERLVCATVGRYSLFRFSNAMQTIQIARHLQTMLRTFPHIAPNYGDQFNQVACHGS